MKRYIALLLTMAFMLMPCASGRAQQIPYGQESFVAGLSGLSDPALLDYVEDTLYAGLVQGLDSESYFVENVSAVYISQEYLEEVAYNSQANIFFGYTLAQLDEQFQDAKYVFTLGQDGSTVVQPFEHYDDTYEKVLKNVMTGGGVILICVTVSVVSAGVGAPAISLIFAASAKTATTFSLAGGAMGALSAGIVKGIQTHDLESSLKAAAFAGSEGFKWGAISGALKGGASTAVALKGATLKGLTMNQAAIIQRQSHYPLDVIKNFRSMEQYYICRDAGLVPQMVNGKMSLVRMIDLNYTDPFGRTNLQRMRMGLAALDPKTGRSYQLHHVGQEMNSTLAILTEAEHTGAGNNEIWHLLGKSSSIDRRVFNRQRIQFWKEMAKQLA